MQNDEVTVLSTVPLVLHSPVNAVKRKHSESHLDDAVSVSSEAQRRVRICIDEEPAVFQFIASTEPSTHVAISDMDIVSVEQSTGEDILLDTVSPVPTTPASFWAYRESTPLIKNEHDILGINAARYEDDFSDEIQDMDFVDPAMDILSGLFSSKLRLDVCARCQVTKAPFCLCRLNDASVSHCTDCSAPFIPHCACVSYSAHRLQPPHPLIRPPLHVPYLRTIRTLWHGGLYPPIEVDAGMSLAELRMLDISVPNSKVSLDRRRRRRKESRSWRLR